MALDRDRIEAEAMRLLNRGHREKALERYLQLVRADPRDRRMRQKVAELYLALGREREAERHFREIVRQLFQAGQERAAIGVLKQLAKMRPDDAELLGELGDAYRASGFPSDAFAAYEQAVRLLERTRPADAVEHQRKMVELRPGDLPLRVRLAELLEAANWSEAAFREWLGLAAEARRLGDPSEQARFLEQALRLRPDHLDAVVDLAELRLEAGRPRDALVPLQRAWRARPDSVRVIELLARAFEALGAREKARTVWLEAARHHRDAGDPLARVRALERALACGARDPELAREVERAAAEAERHRRRLDERPWAQPRTEDEVRAVVRGRVLARYGFPERALEAFESSPAAGSLAVRVARAELLAANGRVNEAVGLLQDIDAPDPEAAAEIADRIAVLRGEPPGGDEDDLVDDELLDDELVDDEPTEGDGPAPAAEEEAPAAAEPTPPPPGDADALEAEGDRLRAAGDLEGAMRAWQEALALDPSRDSLLVKVGELVAEMEEGAAAPAPEPSPVEEDDGFDRLFTEPAGGAPEVAPAPAPAPAAAPGSGGVADAWAWLLVGRPEHALRAAEGRPGLGAALVRARAHRALGAHARAVAELREGLADAPETDPSYAAALFELAGANAATGKLRAAERALDELEDIAPDIDPAGVAALRRGVALLRQEG